MQLFPEQAAKSAEALDPLYFFLLGVTAFFSGLIFVLIFVFAIRYRRGSPAGRSNLSHGKLSLEITWSVIPLAIMLVSFAWGADLYIRGFRPPAHAIDVFVVGKQWMWKIYHTGGRVEINELHVPVDQPVRLTMISEDVIHSFYVPAFRVKQDVLPGRYSSMWFHATKTGDFHLFCAEYCGTSHSLMRGTVTVMRPQDYARWLSDLPTESPEVIGQREFERRRCDSCHGPTSTDKGPALAGLFGRTVELEDGTQTVADLAYFRRSIYEPSAQIVRGYRPLMPTFKPGQVPPEAEISEEEILRLAAYVKSLSQNGDDAGKAEEPNAPSEPPVLPGGSRSNDEATSTNER